MEHCVSVEPGLVSLYFNVEGTAILNKSRDQTELVSIMHRQVVDLQ
jgi:hypothetical protein